GEPYEVEALVGCEQFVYMALHDPYAIAQAEALHDPTRLIQVKRLDVERRHMGTAFGQLDRVKTRIAADIQGRPAAQVARHRAAHAIPFERREIAEVVVGCSLPSVGQMNVVKPWPELRNFVATRSS